VTLNPSQFSGVPCPECGQAGKVNPGYLFRPTTYDHASASPDCHTYFWDKKGPGSVDHHTYAERDAADASRDERLKSLLTRWRKS